MGRVKAGSLRVGEAGELLGAELSASQTHLGAISEGRRESLAAWQLRASLQPSSCEKFRQAVLRQVQDRYADFGPTLAAEHLAEEDGLSVHAETLRRWMGEAGLWRRARRRQPYRRRERKAHFGELVQLDGSFHEWLEERGRARLSDAPGR